MVKMVNKDLPPNTQDLIPKILLATGGCGFIGSNFIRYVLHEHPDWTVINLDKLTYAGNLANLTDIEAEYGLTHHSSHVTDHTPRYFSIKGDICDRKLVDCLLSGEYFTHQASPITGLIPNPESLIPDAVVNFAAESHVDRSILDASPFIQTNIRGTQVLLDAARAHWVCGSDSRLPTLDSRRFLQISTDEVYGALGETGEFTEESSLEPKTAPMPRARLLPSSSVEHIIRPITCQSSLRVAPTTTVLISSRRSLSR